MAKKTSEGSTQGSAGKNPPLKRVQEEEIQVNKPMEGEAERDKPSSVTKDHGKEALKGNSCRSGTGLIFIPNIVKSLLSFLFSGFK